MGDMIHMSVELPASPAAVYAAWLDPAKHSAFTGAQATGEGVVGGPFTAWDGYILGTTTALEPGRRIVQRWRTTEFPEESADSVLEITFEPAGAGTRLTLHHSELPDGTAPVYEKGWQDFYFTPMREYFRAHRG